MRLPVEPLWTTRAVAEMLGLDMPAVRDLARSAGITESRYVRDGRHPRNIRVFTRKEIKIIRARRRVREGPGIRLRAATQARAVKS